MIFQRGFPVSIFVHTLLRTSSTALSGYLFFQLPPLVVKNKNQIRKFFENFDFVIFDMQTVFHFDARWSGMTNGSTSFEERQGQSASGETPPTEQT
jgi:hypothetical protein